MKKSLLLFLQVVLFSFTVSAQAPPRWLWLEGSTTGGDGYGAGLKINRDTLFVYGRASGNLTIANLTINTGGSTIPYVGMFDTAGTSLNNGIWLSDDYTYSGFAYADALGIDLEDNSYITSCDESGGAVYIQRYNRYGTSKWLSETPNQNCRGYGVAADNRGNVYASGNYSGSSITFGSTTLPYGGDAWAGYLTKLDTATGTVKWATYYSSTAGSNNNYTVGGRCATDNQGNVYVAGTYADQPTFYSVSAPPYTSAPAENDANPIGNLFVAEYDSNGNVVQVITATDAGAGYNWYGYAPQIVVDSCDNVYVSGVFESSATFGSITVTTTSGSYNFYVAKWNALGQQWEWVQTGLSPTTASPGGLTLDKNSDVYVTGSYAAPFTVGDTTLNSGNMFVAKYANSNGALIWVANASTAGPGGIGVDSQKYVYLFGNINSNGATFGPYSIAGGGNGSFFAKLDTFPVRTIVPYLDTIYCSGTGILSFNVTGSFNTGNVFTAQLSNDSGSFVNPINLGDTTSTTSGTINITIPPGTPYGSNYLIRVISSNPAGSSYASGCGTYYINNVYINNFYVTIGNKLSSSVSPVSTTVCSGGSVLLTATGSGNNGVSYLWSNGATTDTTTVFPTKDTSFIVTVSSGSCVANDTSTITVNTVLPLTVQPPAAAVCNGQTVTLSVDSTGTNYTWSPSAGLNSTAGSSVMANPSVPTTYTVSGTDSLGCTVTGTVAVSINTPLPLIIYPQSPTVCSGSPTTLTVDTTGSNYTWSPTTGLNTTTGNTTIILNPTATVTYSVTGLDSIGCVVSASDTIKVIAAPNKPTITIHWDTLISSATSDNQWNYEGTPINGATNPTFVVSGSTSGYSVTVTNEANGCTTTSDTTTTAGINQVAITSDEVSIYPNPFNNNIFIKINSAVANVNEWNLQLVDVLGRTLYTNSSLNYSNEIDVSNLPSGFYFITVINKTARAVFPVVKQN